MNRPLLRVAALLCALTLLAGCGALLNMAKREHYRVTKAQDHVYERSCQSLWTKGREVFDLHDYRVADVGVPGLRPMMSYWTRKKIGDRGYETKRVTMTAVVLGETRCKFRFEETTKENGNTRSNAQMSHNLLKEIDPAAAQRYDDEAQKKFP